MMKKILMILSLGVFSGLSSVPLTIDNQTPYEVIVQMNCKWINIFPMKQIAFDFVGGSPGSMGGVFSFNDCMAEGTLGAVDIKSPRGEMTRVGFTLPENIYFMPQGRYMVLRMDGDKFTVRGLNSDNLIAEVQVH